MGVIPINSAVTNQFFLHNYANGTECLPEKGKDTRTTLLTHTLVFTQDEKLVQLLRKNISPLIRIIKPMLFPVAHKHFKAVGQEVLSRAFQRQRLQKSALTGQSGQSAGC